MKGRVRLEGPGSIFPRDEQMKLTTGVPAHDELTVALPALMGLSALSVPFLRSGPENNVMPWMIRLAA